MKTDAYRLEMMSKHGHDLLGYCQEIGLTPELLQSDLHTQWAVTTPLFMMSEMTNCLSCEFIAAHPEVPWRYIADMGHCLAHDYGATNWQKIAEVLLVELELLVAQVDSLLAAMDAIEQD